MNPAIPVNSPSIDIEAFFDGLSWDNSAEIQVNLGALASGIRFLQNAILRNLTSPETIDFKTLTRTLQDSDPMFKICKGFEAFLASQTGDASRFKEVADDLRLMREMIAGLLKYTSGETGREARADAFHAYLALLPKIHTQFIITEDALLRWKAAVMLEQQVDFVSRVLSAEETIATSDAMLLWGNDYLSAITSVGGEGEINSSGSSEITSLLADIKAHCLQLLQSEAKQEVEYYEDTIVLTPAAPGHALSGFSELIFRAKKEAEKDAKFHITLDFEAIPVADHTIAKSGPPVPAQPIHLKRTFQTSFVKMDEVRVFIDGFATSLRKEVDDGVFKDQDSKSLTDWFTDSVIPWVQKDDFILVTN
jgi:hypothetical protein